MLSASAIFIRGVILASFVAAAQEGFENAVIQRILSFLVLLHVEAFALQLAGNFVGQQLIP